jgi:hypothetical protein
LCARPQHHTPQLADEKHSRGPAFCVSALARARTAGAGDEKND